MTDKQLVTPEGIRKVTRRCKWIMFGRFILSLIIPTLFSASAIIIGLYALPPYVGWIPFGYGFLNIGVATLFNWSVLQSANQALDQMSATMLQLHDNGLLSAKVTEVKDE